MSKKTRSAKSPEPINDPVILEAVLMEELKEELKEESEGFGDLRILDKERNGEGAWHVRRAFAAVSDLVEILGYIDGGPRAAGFDKYAAMVQRAFELSLDVRAHLYVAECMDTPNVVLRFPVPDAIIDDFAQKMGREIGGVDRDAHTHPDHVAGIEGS